MGTTPISSSWPPGPRRTPGSKGLTLFAVPADSPGFSRGRKLDKVGQPESDTAELFFQDVRVPKDTIIGELDRGFVHLMTWLPQERLSAAVTNLAHARGVVDETIEYITQRSAFGRLSAHSRPTSSSRPTWSPGSR